MKLTAIHNLIERSLSGQQTGKIFARFYAVGIILFIWPVTRELFISMISWSLLFVISIVFSGQKEWNHKIILFFLFILFASFLLEMAGTNTGRVFGSYDYDRGLGVQINHTPLIIGLNWVFLVYASHDLAERLSGKPVLRVLLGAMFMVTYDAVMEWVAPVMRMWHFEQGYPPVENFVSWFIAGLVFHSVWEILHIRTNNYAARTLFIIQIPFFLLIGLSGLITIP